MVTRPNLFDGLLLGILVHLFDDLRIIFYNARQFSLGKDILQIDVTDNGYGIPPSLQPRIFEPYFTTKSGGTGLGLVLARKTIEDAGGKIWFESTINVGTTFFIQLPLYLEDDNNS